MEAIVEVATGTEAVTFHTRRRRHGIRLSLEENGKVPDPIECHYGTGPWPNDLVHLKPGESFELPFSLHWEAYRIGSGLHELRISIPKLSWPNHTLTRTRWTRCVRLVVNE